MTDTAAILRHLKTGKVLTTASTARLFKCYRLAARVYDLRRRGHRINSAMIKLKSGRRCAVYSLS
jgi:helix-turn-helix protein